MPTLLDTINSPSDLKQLDMGQLGELAKEIRECLVQTVSETGGHLAANLGVVELTLALHSVFDSPKDKFLWDVGHQCYVHKLLTGRRERMRTLRQEGGLSGFPRREESPHDIFNTGHGSTSLSAALGLARARDLQGESGQVVAVIGDGALTGGMALEALNQIGHLKCNVIVILNDNAMSISPNVGAMSGYLSRLRLDTHYLKAKQDFEDLMEHLPLGKSIVEAVERFKTGVKNLVVPGMLFEELGLTYLGPIDGHNLELFRSTLIQARNVKGPVLIHAITKKGQGYEPAEKDPTRFHGTPPFDPDSGETEPATPGAPPSYTRVFGETLCEMARRDSRIVAVTAAMPDGTGLVGFSREFPSRFFDVGMAEQHAVTFAAGLAAGGLRPVVAIYSTFLQRSYDQIMHDVCLPYLPVILALDRGGIVGEDGHTHQGVFDLSYLRHLPNLTVMAPKDEEELRRMLATAIEHKGPCAIRYPRGSGLGVSQSIAPAPLPVGKAEQLREGSNVAILAIGAMVQPSVKAAEKLETRGIQTAVINARFVKPLDKELILSVARQVQHLVTVEDNVLQGGFGSAVLELLQENNITGLQVTRLGLPDQFIEHAPRKSLLARYGLDPDSIAVAVSTITPSRTTSDSIYLGSPASDAH